MMMLISATGLIALYLGLELMSLALYVSRRSIATISGRPRRASNISCSARISSGMLLYGASLLYGFAGTVSFAGIAESADRGKAFARRPCSASCS